MIQYTAVSAFIFLILFAPAILDPKLFGLRPEYAVGCHSNNTYGIALYINIESNCQQNFNTNFKGSSKSCRHISLGKWLAMQAIIIVKMSNRKVDH